MKGGMKKIAWSLQFVVMAVMILFAHSAFAAVTPEYSISAGAVIPVQSGGGARMSASPMVKADIFFRINSWMSLGGSVGQAFNFQKKSADGPGSAGSGAPGSQSQGAQAFAGVSHHHNGGDTTNNNTTNNTTNTDSHDTTNNTEITNTTINNYYPSNPGAAGVPLPNDYNESSVFFGEPAVRIGPDICLNFSKDKKPENSVTIRPYALGFYGISRVDLQRGGWITANSYGYGAGVQFIIENDYFVSVEALRRRMIAQDTSFDHVQTSAGIGVRFE